MSEPGTAPLPQRDIRSAATPFKRDRDSSEKWSAGTRPLSGAHLGAYVSAPVTYTDIESDFLMSADETQNEKLRPGKPMTIYLGRKSHANRTPKPASHYDTRVASNNMNHRIIRKVDALVTANEDTTSPLSRSLLELLPQHANSTTSFIQSAIRDQDSNILYSFDNSGASPGVKGRAVGLDSLVEMAEQKWATEQTERIVKSEYEVLDAEGETTILSKKKKGSPKQKAIKNLPAVVKDVDVEEDDGFELI